METKQGYVRVRQKGFCKSEAKRSDHFVFHSYFQYLIIPEGSNKKHIGISVLLNVREICGQLERLLTHF